MAGAVVGAWVGGLIWGALGACALRRHKFVPSCVIAKYYNRYHHSTPDVDDNESVDDAISSPEHYKEDSTRGGRLLGSSDHAQLERERSRGARLGPGSATLRSEIQTRSINAAEPNTLE